MNPRLSAAVRLLAIAAVLLSAVLNNLAVALVPEVVILCYAVAIWRATAADPVRRAMLAEQPYFVAYLVSLSTFVGMLLPIIWTREIPEKPVGLFLMIAVAIASTVTGLLAMTTLKDLADVDLHGPGGNLTAGATTSASASTAAPTMPLDPQLVASLLPGGKLLMEQQTLVLDSLRAMNGSITRLTAAVETLTMQATLGASGASAFNEGVTQMRQVMADYVELVKTVIPAIAPADHIDDLGDEDDEDAEAHHEERLQ